MTKKCVICGASPYKDGHIFHKKDACIRKLEAEIERLTLALKVIASAKKDDAPMDYGQLVDYAKDVLEAPHE
jgi:hypothetical protein